MNFRRSKVALVAAMVLLSPLAGCPGHLPDDVTGTGGTGGTPCVPHGGTTTPPATFETVKESMRGFAAVSSCNSAPCHARGNLAPPVNPLVLQEDANLYMNMMTYVSAACGGIPLVNPGKPEESALIKIMTAPCGTTLRMPFGCVDDQCMPAENMAAISQWIANCAPP